MTMFNDYTFQVEAVHPSGIVSCVDGKVSAVRQFIVRSEFAEELGVRLLGKWANVTYTTPILPAEYPSAVFSMVAKSFSIEQKSACIFNVDSETDGVFIGDLESQSDMEKYWPSVGASNDAYAVVTVNYSEPEWDCVGAVGSHIQPDTAISVQINPAYEMFTLPDRNLVWADLTKERELKADSFAYKIIPKSDVIVSWHNIPVVDLATILDGLNEFRGSVNDAAFGETMFCSFEGSAGDASIFAAETLMFIDCEEDRSKRTTGFAASLMDTTTLKLHFKQKDIVEGVNHYGWNHLFLDHSKNIAATSCWARVKQSQGGGTEVDLFTQKDFTNIFTW